MKQIIFTDLDGTLLDENYQWSKAKDVIEELKRRKIPIIFCSAKTRAEQEKLRKEMGITDPFIVEDGSAIVIPKESEIYTHAKIKDFEIKSDKDDITIILGLPHSKIVEHIEEHRKKVRDSGEDDKIKYYKNTSVEEISEITGLSIEDANLAKKREFSETVIECSKPVLNSIKSSDKISAHIGGKFIHVYGSESDKGKAVKILTDLYREKYGKVYTIGIGNSYTDIPMLLQVDQPAIVKNPDGWIDIEIKNLYRAKGVATEGWVEVIKKFILNDFK